MQVSTLTHPMGGQDQSNFELFRILFHDFSVSFSFAVLFSLSLVSFRFWFPVFRFEAKHAKNQVFFASKRNNFGLFFASFRINRKRTAHPRLKHKCVDLIRIFPPPPLVKPFDSLQPVLSSQLEERGGVWNTAYTQNMSALTIRATVYSSCCVYEHYLRQDNLISCLMFIKSKPTLTTTEHMAVCSMI
jgi:hypothetical protein